MKPVRASAQVARSGVTCAKLYHHVGCASKLPLITPLFYLGQGLTALVSLLAIVVGRAKGDAHKYRTSDRMSHLCLSRYHSRYDKFELGTKEGYVSTIRWSAAMAKIPPSEIILLKRTNTEKNKA